MKKSAEENLHNAFIATIFLLGSFYTIEEFYNWSSMSELYAAYLKNQIVFIQPLWL
jgi:hypothetical protein